MDISGVFNTDLKIYADEKKYLHGLYQHGLKEAEYQISWYVSFLVKPNESLAFSKVTWEFMRQIQYQWRVIKP